MLEINFNPDAMTVTDLDRAESVFRLLSHYCLFKVQAIEYRKRGFIELALDLEKDCDSLYKQIPVEYRW